MATLVSLLVRVVENFLYPVLIKDRLRVPPISIFVSLVGGLLLFGWSGLVLGPAILTLTSVLLEICCKAHGLSLHLRSRARIAQNLLPLNTAIPEVREAALLLITRLEYAQFLSGTSVTNGALAKETAHYPEVAQRSMCFQL